MNMQWIDWIRCRLAMWLEIQQDRIGRLASWVAPDSEAWDQYDQWADKQGHYDWWKKHGKP